MRKFTTPNYVLALGIKLVVTIIFVAIIQIYEINELLLLKITAFEYEFFIVKNSFINLLFYFLNLFFCTKVYNVVFYDVNITMQFLPVFLKF